MAAKAEVITTVRLIDDPEWTACELQESHTGRNVLLVQDDQLNVGIIGTAEQLSIMADRIKEVISHPITASSVLSKIGASPDGTKG